LREISCLLKFCFFACLYFTYIFLDLAWVLEYSNGMPKSHNVAKINKEKFLKALAKRHVSPKTLSAQAGTAQSRLSNLYSKNPMFRCSTDYAERILEALNKGHKKDAKFVFEDFFYYV